MGWARLAETIAHMAKITVVMIPTAQPTSSGYGENAQEISRLLVRMNSAQQRGRNAQPDTHPTVRRLLPAGQPRAQTACSSLFLVAQRFPDGNFSLPAAQQDLHGVGDADPAHHQAQNRRTLSGAVLTRSSDSRLPAAISASQVMHSNQFHSGWTADFTRVGGGDQGCIGRCLPGSSSWAVAACSISCCPGGWVYRLRCRAGALAPADPRQGLPGIESPPADVISRPGRCVTTMSPGSWSKVLMPTFSG